MTSLYRCPLLCCLCLFVLLSGLLPLSARAQSPSVQLAAGSPCVGQDMTFLLIGGGDGTCSVSWSVYGSDYTLVSESGSEIQVRWNRIQSGAYVSAYYYDCSTSPASVSSAIYTIGDNVSPSVSLSASATTVCQGSAVSFTATPTNGGSLPYYTWSVNGTTAAAGSDNSFSTSTLLVGSHTVECRMQSSLACITEYATTASTTVTVNPIPAAGISPSGAVSFDGSGTLTATTGAGYSYQWQVNGTNIPGATGSAYTVVQSGSYRVVVTANGCASTSNVASVTSNCGPHPVIITATPGGNASLATKLTATTRSLAFDGINDYVNVPNMSWAGGAATVEFWLKLNTPDVNNGSLFSYGASNGPRFAAFLWSDKMLYWDYGNISGNGRLSVNYAPYLDKWTHVALVSTGTGGNFKAIYLNGVLVNSAATSDGSTVAASNLTIGAFPGLSAYQKASIDDFRIWNKVRSQAEIQANMNLSPAPNAPNLVGYWKLDEGSGTTTADASGKGNTGILTNGPVWLATATAYTWAPSTRLNATTGAVVYATPLTNTNYTATATFANGCTSFAVATVGGNDYNYVITNAIQSTGITTDAQLQSLIIDKDQLSQSITYLDGLSQSVQTVSTQASPTKQDLVGFANYDALGRQVRQYMPYSAGNNGSYKTDVLTAQPAFYQSLKGDNKAFSESRFENSPLSRVIEQSAPGTTWQLAATPEAGKTQKMSYYSNAANEVRYWNFNVSTKTAIGSASYSANTLSVTQSTDEHGYRIWNYKDKAGQTVAKRVQKSANAFNEPTQGLLASYSFSGNANDITLNGNNGTVSGATLTTDRFGATNSAYQFSGSSYISLPGTNFQLANYTYSYWAKPTSNPAPGALYGIFSVGSTGGDQLSSLMNAYAGYSASTGWAGGGYNASGGGSTALSGTLPTAGTWYYITVTRDNANVKVYVNGTLSSTVSTGGALPFYGTGTVVGILGGRFNITQSYQGALDEFRIYNRALTATEITALYTISSAPTNLTGDLMTYYVYDDFGNLRFTIPPEGANNLGSVNYSITYNDAFCQKWLFAYDYDARFRATEKLTPGGGATWLVYDPADRVILSQDAAHRGLNQWMFTKYDVLGRTIMNGRYTQVAATQAAMQKVVDDYYINYPTRTYYETRKNADFSDFHGYDNQAYPVMPKPNSAAGQPYEVNYYDDYDFDYNGVNGSAAETAKGEPAYINFGTPYLSTPASTKGKPTGKRVLVLGTSTWLTSAVYYDPQGRVIQTQDENSPTITAPIVATGTGRNAEVTVTLYEGLTNRVKQTEHRHCYGISNTNSKSLTILQEFEYDFASRLKKSTMTIGSQAKQVLAAYTYNEAGELTQKMLGRKLDGTGPLQTVDYQYNLRGWLKSINGGTLTGTGVDADIFAMSFKHEEANTTNPQFNGNLSRQDWVSKTDHVQRTYQYGYDGLNRFLSADYSSTVSAEKFSVSTTYHDDNGNIKTINRENLISRNVNAVDNFGTVDKLQYEYDGNRLKTVEDDPLLPANALATDFKEKSRKTTNPQEYTYDPSGKLQSDKNKGLNTNFIYNDLDLPATIQLANNDNITNVYAATGDKLQMTVTQNSSIIATYKYIGGIVYLNDIPQFIPTPEGRAIWISSGGSSAWVYEYFYRDHLGDLRVAFKEGGPNRTNTATLESVSDAAWSNVSTPVRNQERAFNAGGYSAKLVPANPLGPWKTVPVNKGDVITVSAVGSYISTSTPNNAAVNLITYVNGLPTQSQESGNQKTWLSLGLAITPLATNSSQSSVPKAYLEYVLQTPDQAVTQRKRQYITAAALNGWETLQMTYTAEADGFLQVLVANDSDQPVWFDNVSITVKPSLIVQETHYDPWGLELAGIENIGNPEHRWKFQGKESITDLSLYWQDFGARHYDAQLGRWHVGDPAGQFGSPYVGMGNNPVVGTDPDGRWVNFVIGAIVGGIGGYSTGKALGKSGWGLFAYTIAGAGIGAATAGIGSAVSSGTSAALGSAGSTLVGGAAGGAFNGAAMAGLAGQNIGQGALYGGIGGLAGSTAGLANIHGIVPGALYGAATGGLISGGISSLSGGNFGDGFKSGAISGAILGGINGGISAAQSRYERNILFGGGTRAGKMAQIADLAQANDVYNNGVNRILYDAGEDVHGKTIPVLAGGEINDLEFAVSVGPGIVSNIHMNIHGSLRQMRSSFLHEFNHANDLYTGVARDIYNSYGHNIRMTHAHLEMRSYTVNLNDGYNRSHYAGRVNAWRSAIHDPALYRQLRNRNSGFE